MAEFHPVCTIDAVPEGEGKTVLVAGKLIALFHQGGNWFALDDTCPHMGASLAGGHVEQGMVTCPWHAWRFSLSDGGWDENPRLGVRCYPVRIVGNQVQVQV